MSVTPTSNDALVLTHLRDTLADAATFRANVGADDRAEAILRIHGDYALEGREVTDTEEPEEDPEGVPRGVIYFANDSSSDLIGNNTWIEKSQLVLLLEFIPPEELTDRWDQQIWFLNQVDAIKQEMQELATEDPGAGPYLAISGFRRRFQGHEDPRQTNGVNIWGAEYEVLCEGTGGNG